jgi:CRISPR/Cas system-associated exonuclease Cas4 (RecB family)
MPGVVPWSYSSLSSFETCPRRHYLTKIAKVVTESQSAEMAEGNAVHKALELAVAGSKPLEAKYHKYQPIVTRIRSAPGQKLTERKFGLTAAFKPTTFFAKDVWFRGVIDLNILRKRSAVTLDYKTGKVKEDHDQLRLFAATTFAENPHLTKITTGYLWLAFDKTTTQEFTPEDVPLIWQDFVPRVRRMEIAEQKNEWPPKPSGLCRKWCPVGKSNCEFCGE